MSLDRAIALIALACDPAASEEESRTAAVQACRIISKEGLLNGGRLKPNVLRPTAEGGEWGWSHEPPKPKPKRPVADAWGPPPKPSRKNKPAGHHQNPRPSPLGTPASRRAELLRDLSVGCMKMGTGKVLCAVCHTFIPMGSIALHWPNRRPFENTAHYTCVR